MEAVAVTRFRSFLQIKSVQPNPDYEGIIDFLRKYSAELKLEFNVLECVPGKPIVWLTLPGSDPSLPSILLNCHTDVVPVFPDNWLYDPFAAVKDADGKIYARGSQDMKCVGIQYAEALRKLMTRGDKFKRTINLLFVPDEEIGGADGMEAFAETDEFKELNVGVVLDEGLASPTEVISIFYGERCAWWVDFIIEGNPGHGSQFLEGTVGEKLSKLLFYLYDFRAKQEAKLAANPELTLGDVVSCNVTKVTGGVQHNVVPDTIRLSVDMRLPPDAAIMQNTEKLIKEWAEGAGNGVSVEFPCKQVELQVTATDTSDPWWRALTGGLDKAGVVYKPDIFSAGTDSQRLRERGLPAYGFSPMSHTPILLHDHNEYLDESVFLKGVDIYMDVIGALADVAAF